MLLYFGFDMWFREGERFQHELWPRLQESTSCIGSLLTTAGEGGRCATAGLPYGETAMRIGLCCVPIAFEGSFIIAVVTAYSFVYFCSYLFVFSLLFH